MPDGHVQSRRFARQSAACSSRGIGALRLKRVLLIIGGLCCCALSSVAQTSDPTTDQPNKSWTATTDLKSGDLLPTRIPVQIIESHSQNGNRTIDKRLVKIRGTDGRLEPYQEIETEIVAVDTATVRTTTRTFAQDVNGVKALVQVTEEEKHVLPGDDSNIVRVTSNPDVNGRLQPVQREMVETRKISEDVEETNTTVMLPNINGGLAPALKTHELRKLRGDGTTESQKITLLADGAGKWELSEMRQVTTSQEGANRTTEERVLRRDAEGKLVEVSRVVSEQSNGSSGEQRTIAETYSVDVPGTTRDGNLHLVERASTSSQTNASGGRTSEQKVEQPNPGDPGAGLRVSILVNDKMVPGPSGEQSTVTIRARDSNGSLGIVSVDTTKSDRIPTIQIQQTPSEQRK
jgi:hypothetical protein